MFHRRKGLHYAALLFSLAVPLGLSGAAFAQSGSGSPTDTPALQLAQYSSTVLELQRELNQLGFDAGQADGLMGSRTRNAIRAYQRDHNLRPDGQPRASLLQHVRATAQSQSTTPVPAQDTSSFDRSSRQVAEIQEGLHRLGYPVGRASGRLDDETRAAIRSYETDHGLLMSGEPSTELFRHIRERISVEQTQAEAQAQAQTQTLRPVDANTLARIQTELRTRGYPIQLISGRMDAATRQAIREYQQGQGVAVTGEPSQALLEALRTGSTEPTGDAGLSREHRAAAQRALNEHGYNAGPPDGVLGPRSRIAIRNFQARNNIGVTGELDAPTLEGLGVRPSTTAPAPAADRSYQERARDNFSDGDHTRNPAWRIVSGRFEVRGGGLNSVVTPASTRPQDVGLQILGEILNQQLGVERPAQEAAAAAAYLPVQFAQEFRITVQVSGSDESYSHVDLGPYRGNALNHGYRLSHRSNEPLQLVFVDERGSSVIASSRYRLENREPQRVVWQRDAAGRMTVTRDNEVLIDVVDRKMNERFDGFSLINAGGNWTLHEILIEDRN